MPLYICNAAPGAIAEDAKPQIAEDVTRIHCEVTGAPSIFVHVFFFEAAPEPALGGKAAMLAGAIRSGRTDEQKERMAAEMRASIATHAGLAPEAVAAALRETPASWVMEGGDILPEPGEEAAWLAAQEAKMSAPAG